MSNKDEELFAYNLKDTRVYSFTDFKKVLKSHGFPHSKPWIRKAEKQGLLPSSRLPTTGSVKAPKVYTGKQIKDIISSLLTDIENTNVS